jgi:hypothetical protein
MTLRRPKADGNSHDAKSGSSDPTSRRVSLSVRDAVVLAGGLVAGIITGLLTYLAVHNLPVAVLAGVPAFAGTVNFLEGHIS